MIMSSSLVCEKFCVCIWLLKSFLVRDWLWVVFNRFAFWVAACYSNTIAWWNSETQCLATNFAQRFLTTTFLHGSTFVDREHFCETKRLLTHFSGKEWFLACKKVFDHSKSQRVWIVDLLLHFLKWAHFKKKNVVKNGLK